MWSLIYCICLLVMGLGAVAALMPPDPEESPLLRIGLGMSLGPGIGGLGLIGFSMLGRLPSAVLIFFLTAPFAILLCVYRSRFFRRGKISWGWIKGRFGWLNIICLVAIAYGVGVSIHYAVADGVIMGDAFAIWMLKAKVLATQALYPRPDYFTDVSLSFSHLRYPILVPMIGAGVHAMSGRLEGDLVSAPFLLSYFGLVMAVFGAVRSWGNWTSGLAAAAMFMTTPLALAQAGNGMADMTLTAFFGCSLISILRWRKLRRVGDLILAMIFTGCMAWTKNEGAAMAAVNILLVLIFVPTPRRLRALAFGVGVILMYLPWYFYARHLPRTDEDYTSHLTLGQLAGNVHRLGYIVAQFGWNLIDPHAWGIFWFLPVAAFIFKPRGARGTLFLWVALLLQILIYIPPYMVAPGDLAHLMRYSLGRLLLHATPAAALIVGLQFADCGVGKLSGATGCTGFAGTGDARSSR